MVRVTAPRYIMFFKNVSKYNRIPVGCELIKLIAKCFQLMLCVAWLLDTAAAQTFEHGTYFVAGFSPDYAVVAIDSRELQGSHVNDRYCKIQPLSHNSFFFSRGVTSATDNFTGANIFDARQLAHQVYIQAGFGTTNFDGLADVWASKMIDIYNTKPSEFAASAIKNIMVDGFFVGLDEKGDVTFGGQRVTFQQSPTAQFFKSPEPKPTTFTDPAQAPTYASGYFEIVREFARGGQTDRAKKVLAELGALPSNPDGVAILYTAIVKAVRDWTGEHGIGGDVASIILERGRDWRWYYRPDYCPEH